MSENIIWKSFEKIKSIEKREDRLVLLSSVGGEEKTLTLAFAAEGGIRLFSETEGYFKPKSFKPFEIIEDGNGKISIKADNSIASVNYAQDKWKIYFKNSDYETVHTISSEQLLYGFEDGVQNRIRLDGDVFVDEVIYGLGERFNAINQVGTETSSMCNVDKGYQLIREIKGVTQAYKNIPLIHSNRGYSLFLNTFYTGIADIGYKESNIYSLIFFGSQLDVYVYTGTPRENLIAYTNLTGKPKVLPKWAFGYWGGGYTFYWNKDYKTDRYGEENCHKTFDAEIEGYKRLGVKLEATYAENSGSFIPSIYEKANKNGIRVLGWTHPQVDFLTHQGFSLEEKQRRLPDVPYEKLPHARSRDNFNEFYSGEERFAHNYPDYSNPTAVDLIRTSVEEPIKWGLRGLMVDYGEYLPLHEAQYYNGMLSEEMHNFIGYCYTKTYNDVFTELLGNDFVLFARAGCAGSQSWGAVFNGDQGSSFTGLNLAYHGGLNISACGFSCYGTDLGGLLTLQSDNTQELYLRWMQYAAFNPLMRQHGTQSRNPWTYGVFAENTFLKFYWLRMNLIELLYHANLFAGKTGLPIVQNMAIAFPNEKKLSYVYDQFLFADELLVCPVLADAVREREVHLPSGDLWVDIWTGEVHSGGQTVSALAPLDRIPVYIKGGAAIPIKLSKQFELTRSMQNESFGALLVTPTENARTTEFMCDDGILTANTVKNSDGKLTVTRSVSDTSRVLLVRGVSASAVTVDGKPLCALETKPEDDSAVGYFVEKSTNSTVIFAGDDWHEVVI